MKLISIIIPYYKKRKYTQKTLKSICKQIYKVAEIIFLIIIQRIIHFQRLSNLNSQKLLKLIKEKEVILVAIIK